MMCASRSFVEKMMLVAMALMAIVSCAIAQSELLQDVCVADASSGVKMNGFPCKSNVTADDFYFCGLSTPAATNNAFGSTVTPASVQNLPGLNTLGVSLSRIDYAPDGINPPHLHPRASEIIFVLEGELEVGFVTTDNTLYSKSIKKGEVFVFPRGLIHFHKNIGKVAASAITAFNSQSPGTLKIAPSLFSATPPLPDDVLMNVFQLDANQVGQIKSKYAPKYAPK